MKKAITWIVILGLLGAAVGGFLWFRNRQTEAAAVVEVLRTGETVRDDLELAVAASGNVRVARSADLGFWTSGTVIAVNVEVGDRVVAGQVLARLDDESLVDAVRQADLELSQARLNLETATKPVDEEDVRLAERAIQEAVQAMRVAETSQALAEVRGSIDQTRAQEFEKDAREAYENYTDLLKKYDQPLAYAAGITAAYMEAEGNVGITALRSEYAVEQAKSQWVAANQRYAKAQRDLEQLTAGADETQLEQLELRVEQAALTLEQAHADLGPSLLVAPFDGIVASVNLQVGTPPPSPGQPTIAPAVSLLDDSALYVDLSIDEIDIGLIDEGQTVALTLDAHPDVELAGTIDRIGLLPTTTGGVIAYSVRVQITSSAGALIRDGMTASARITVGQIEDVVLVPNWAIRTDQDTDEIIAYCYCLDTGEPKRVVVELGASNETWTVVTSGLEEGATVALVSEETNLFDFEGPPSGMGPP